MKHCLILLVFAIAFIMNGCSDNETPATPEIFSCGSYSHSLEDANIYLTAEYQFIDYPTESTPDRNVRHYAISDGTYKNVAGSSYGYSLSDFEGATYSIHIYLVSSQKGESFSAGNYQQRVYMFDYVAPEELAWVSPKRMGTITEYILWDAPDNFKMTESLYSDHSPIKISGGVEPGTVMKINFNGIMRHEEVVNNVNTQDYNDKGTLYFKGTIIDGREN